MSIRDEINSRIAERRLFRLPHSLMGVATARTVFVSEPLYEITAGPWTHDAEGMRFAELRAHLDVFTGGGLISLAADPYKKPKATYLAAIDPVDDGVWDIRS